MTRSALIVLITSLAGCTATQESNHKPAPQPTTSKESQMNGQVNDQMSLGNFSVSLAVKDIAASRAFYEKLGFKTMGGDQAQNWLIMQSDTATIGLFQGMFEKNMLTFNPGWDRNAANLKDFADVRELQRIFKGHGLKLISEADESSTGPASLMLVDPDGNPILIDQHIPSPK